MPYTDEEKHYVWTKCGGRCIYGQKRRVLLRDYDSTWEIDHAKPLSRDGVDDRRNWVVACYKHNHQKGDKTRQEFEQWLEWYPMHKPCGW